MLRLLTAMGYGGRTGPPSYVERTDALYNVGVRDERVFVLKRIDADFFY